ncbi:diacylglycerol/lipid kinase family protein [Ezakiella coagulans]|uniref:diacylglycerol/lipid kinase family protein n=1 Tax=Ezakiella coagulans TaxID=46507 RepID=UPI0020148A35|nr:diacylglycerol kinase family protein [Ezakiella coagulans]UQK59896.1 lipid kinase [Ezakiella coagulans]
MSFKKYLFILSKKAAGGRNLPSVEEIRKYVDPNLDIEIVTTEYKNHTTELAREFGLKNPGSVIVACGGDGTLREVAKGVYGTDSYFAFLPCGTGNDFNRSVSVENDTIKLLKNIHNLKPDVLDLIEIGGDICLNVWSFGFDADLLVEAKKIQKKYPKVMESSYLFAALKTVFGKISSKIEYEVETVSGEIKKGSGYYTLGNIANGKYYGGGFNPAPLADVSDGVLNFMLVDKMSVVELVSLISKYKRGEHTSIKKVHMFEVTRGKIRSLEGELIGNFDGDIIPFREAEFRVLKHALKFARYEENIYG